MAGRSELGAFAVGAACAAGLVTALWWRADAQREATRPPPAACPSQAPCPACSADRPPAAWPKAPAPSASKAAAPRKPPKEAQLVGLWNFRDGCDEARAPNRAGGAGDAQIAGARCVKATGGSALWFDGEAKVDVADSPPLHITGPITLAAWAQPNAAEGLQTIVGKWLSPDSYLLLLEQGRFVFRLATPGAGAGEVEHAVSAPAGYDAFSHVVGVYDGDSQRLYVNGERVAEAPLAGEIQASGRPVTIGHHPPWNGYHGLIGEVRIYDGALTEPQIKALFARGFATPGKGRGAPGH